MLSATSTVASGIAGRVSHTSRSSLSLQCPLHCPLLPFRHITQKLHRKCAASGRKLHVKRLEVSAALAQNTDLKMGATAPDFQLPEPLSGTTISLSDYKDKEALLVMFICNHCPFVIHLKEAIVQLAIDYQHRGVGFVAISSNSIQTHPQDGPEQMAEDARRYAYPFPYLYDESQEVAKAYKAACTPEFYIFDGQQKLSYHGQFDSSRPRGGNDLPVTGEDVRAALDDVLAGQPVHRPIKPSIGCSIKWHP